MYKRKIFIVEDLSQAHGLNHYSNKVFKGDLSIFSLYPGKNLGANGDAGIIITNNKVYYKKLKMFRNSKVGLKNINIALFLATICGWTPFKPLY